MLLNVILKPRHRVKIEVPLNESEYHEWCKMSEEQIQSRIKQIARDYSEKDYEIDYFINPKK